MSTKDQYRKQLIEFEQKIGEGFDKTLITLSGGALGLSLTFVHEIVGPDSITGQYWLLASWIFWAGSLSSLLLAYYFAQLAYRLAINQLDSGTIKGNNTGGGYSKAVNILNGAGGLGFLLGLATIIIFAFLNLGGGNGSETQTDSQTAAPATESSRKN